MHLLTRTVRLAVNTRDSSVGNNGFAGNPPLSGFGRWYEIEVTCRGHIDPKTGYLIDIKTVDSAVRDHAFPLLQNAVRVESSPERAVASMFEALASILPASLQTLRLKPSPYYDLAMDAGDQTHVLVRQRFDFSAAHRLHSPALSDEENRRLYGKCNNPRGHGHNYVVQPVVKLRIDAAPSFSLHDLELITDQHVIKPFDHKHLNEDTPEFRVDQGGVLPSVENIARICFERLRPAIASHSARPELVSVTVWETDRTSATYPAM
ncbi:MAG: 6-carboxytetrahydropterin synthase [Phycisphaerales bacterium]